MLTPDELANQRARWALADQIALELLKVTPEYKWRRAYGLIVTPTPFEDE